MYTIQTGHLNVAFFSSSSFTIPILESIIGGQKTTLAQLAKAQYQQVLDTFSKDSLHPLSVFSLPKTIWEHPAISKPIHLSCVISQPDRILRGKEVVNSIVEYSRAKSLPLFTPDSINNEKETYKNMCNDLDISIVASYGQIISQNVLDVAKYGNLNWHPSKLPLYRGSTPLQSAIANGDNETALTWILMNERMDDGDMYLQLDTNISKSDTFTQAIQTMGELGGQTWALVTALRILDREMETEGVFDMGDFVPMRQDYSMATKTQMISKDHKFVAVKKQDAQVVYNHFRAYIEFPGTWIHDELFGECKIVKASGVVDEHQFHLLQEDCAMFSHYGNWFIIGTKTSQKILYKCAEDYLEIETICLASGKTITLAGYNFA
jgi:methionyl-tRNA formyltransferase